MYKVLFLTARAVTNAFQALTLRESSIYFFRAPGSAPKDAIQKERDNLAGLSLFVDAAPIDHPSVIDFYRGLEAPNAAADAPAAAAAAVTMAHSRAWGRAQHGLFAIGAPLENDSEHGFLCGLRLAIPDEFGTDHLPQRVWGREMTIRHPINALPKSAGRRSGPSSASSDKEDDSHYNLDVVLWERTGATPAGSSPYLRPSIIVEIGVGTADASAKVMQVRKYAMNVLGDLCAPEEPHAIFTVAVMYDTRGVLASVVVDAYWLTREAAPVKQALYRCVAHLNNICTVQSSEVSELALTRVFRALRAAVVSPTLPLPTALCADLTKPDDRMKVVDGKVYKYFNNLNRQYAEQIARSTVVWRALGRAETVAGPPATRKDMEVGHLFILCYAFISGGHEATRVQQWMEVIEDLQSVQAAGFCHADVREANMVFSDRDGVRSRLIDFDLSGRHAQDTYPRRFYPIADGARHEGAVSAAVMLMEHDWFSLAAIMDFYVFEEDPQGIWTQATTAVRAGDLAQAIDALRRCSHGRVKRLRVGSITSATGSPPRQ